MRAVVVALALGSSGCAWVFQDKLPAGYNSEVAPRCTSSKGLVVLDGVLGLLHGLTAVAELANDQRTDDDNALLAGSLVWTAIHTASAMSGSGWADECRRAQDSWDADQASDDDGEKRERLRRLLREDRSEPTAPSQRETAPLPAPAPKESVATPRGFYCAQSAANASVGVCARQKAECAQLASGLAVGVPDVGRCTLVETAYCFDAGSGDAEERCAPTPVACAAQHDQLIARGDGARIGACVEAD